MSTVPQLQHASRRAARRRLLAILSALIVLGAVALTAALLLTRDEGQALTWAPPRLKDPQTIRVSSERHSLNLSPRRDYVLRLPSRPLAAAGGLTVTGGRNVVLIGGEISIPRQGPQAAEHARRGLLLKDQTGVVHVEGLKLSGDISDGLNLDEKQGAVVQLQNIRVETLRARDERTFRDTHPDLIQTFAGPTELRVDGLTGTTDYQGFFLHPTQNGGRPPRRFDLRRVDISTTPTAGILLWRLGPRFPLALSDVWVEPNPDKGREGSLKPLGAWREVRAGSPPDGDFVPAGLAGTSYESPGYVD